MEKQELKELGKEILAFVDEYAGVLPDFDESDGDKEDSFTSPDAGALYVAGLIFSKGEIPAFPVWSEWGCGGYKPYTSKEGREKHDELLRRIESVK